MDYQVRKLSKFGKGDFKGTAYGKGNAAVSIVASDEGVYSVKSTDFTLSAADIGTLLEQRFLRSTDLVKFDGCWVSLADSLPFGDVAAPHARREARIRWLKGAGLIALAFGWILLRVYG